MIFEIVIVGIMLFMGACAVAMALDEKGGGDE